MPRNVTEEQKAGYGFGQILVGLGFALFFVGMLTMGSNFFSSNQPSMPQDTGTSILGMDKELEQFRAKSDKMANTAGTAMVFGVVGMIIIIVGGLVGSLSAKGAAGSGLILDPEQARKDLEPFSRMEGGMLKDALDEAGLIPDKPDEPLVKVRCLQCKELNDEDSKFCKNCGSPL